MPDYADTKSANILVTASLAKEVGNSGVTVNTVSPGPIVTPGAKTLLRQLAQQQGWGDDWAETARHLVLERPRIGLVAATNHQSPITNHQSPSGRPTASRVAGVNHNWLI
jgi:NAD(P)-dependent dehydrogenase (short-subunit alcohol dehydrogenase family)